MAGKARSVSGKARHNQARSAQASPPGVGTPKSDVFSGRGVARLLWMTRHDGVCWAWQTDS